MTCTSPRFFFANTCLPFLTSFLPCWRREDTGSREQRRIRADVGHLHRRPSTSSSMKAAGGKKLTRCWWHTAVAVSVAHLRKIPVPGGKRPKEENTRIYPVYVCCFFMQRARVCVQQPLYRPRNNRCNFFLFSRASIFRKPLVGAGIRVLNDIPSNFTFGPRWLEYQFSLGGNNFCYAWFFKRLRIDLLQFNYSSNH